MASALFWSRYYSARVWSSATAAARMAPRSCVVRLANNPVTMFSRPGDRARRGAGELDERGVPAREMGANAVGCTAAAPTVGRWFLVAVRGRGMMARGFCLFPDIARPQRLRPAGLGHPMSFGLWQARGRSHARAAAVMRRGRPRSRQVVPHVEPTGFSGTSGKCGPRAAQSPGDAGGRQGFLAG